MTKNAEFRKELFITTVVWVFLVVGAGTFLGLKMLMKPKEEAKEEEMVAEVVEEEEPEGEKVEEPEEKEEEAEEPKVEPAATDALGPSPVGTGINANGTNSATTYDAVGHVGADGIKVIYYKTLVWGTVVANFEDFRAKVAETLSDARGWVRGGLRFVEVSSGQDLNIVLSDAANLEGYNGYCSGSLSCTSGYNEVIINDERWREGTAETAGGLSIRDYQNMVVNHEVGHWLGHYNHTEACEVNGGVAPIMLQQSTGLRNCRSFNPWPLDSELRTLR